MDRVKVKIIAVAVAVIVLLIIVLQNTASVESRILFVTVTMPQALLLALTVAVGFVLGLLTALTMRSKQTKRPVKDKKSTAEES